jgi:hypothetical protein
MRELLEKLERLDERRRMKPSRRRRAKAKRKKRRKNPSLVRENAAVTRLSELVEKNEKKLGIFVSDMVSADGRLELSEGSFESDSSEGETHLNFWVDISDESEIEYQQIEDAKPTFVQGGLSLNVFPHSRGKIELSLDYEVEVVEEGDGGAELGDPVRYRSSIYVSPEEIEKVKNIRQLKNLFDPLLRNFQGLGELERGSGGGSL